MATEQKPRVDAFAQAWLDHQLVQQAVAQKQPAQAGREADVSMTEAVTSAIQDGIHSCDFRRKPLSLPSRLRANPKAIAPVMSNYCTHDDSPLARL